MLSGDGRDRTGNLLVANQSLCGQCGRSCSRRVGASSLRRPVEAAGGQPRRLAVPLLLDESPILGHIIKSLEDRRERNLIVLREFFGSAHDFEISCRAGCRRGFAASSPCPAIRVHSRS